MRPIAPLSVEKKKYPMVEHLNFTAFTAWATHTSAAYLLSLGYLTLLALMILVERRVPHAREPSGSSARFNVSYALVMLGIMTVLKPAALAVALALTAACGAGWIGFSPTPTGWLAAFVSLLLISDLLEYLFHRAQHTFPILWRMHSFHHSAEHFDVTLAYRNFWAEPLLKMALLYPIPGVLLNCPEVFQYVAHMNLRFSPKGWGFVVTHPQYHRVHHSRHALHYNKNLCALLPLWDFLFGTLHRPVAGEFVDVGLVDRGPPTSIRQALVWAWSREGIHPVATEPGR
jgi:sterol desaturase/sphingolipid hydroxylase (fatty acid hydroxylase superfamily)